MNKLLWDSISDIAEINPETTNSKWSGREILYIDIASVGCGVFNSKPELVLYDEAPSRARRVVKHGDILISTVRPNRRSMIQILNPAENTVASTGFALLRPKRIEDSDYLFGIICNKKFTLELEMLAYGAAYPAVSTDDICRPFVYLPEEKERDRISNLLRPISKFNQSRLTEIIQEYISALFRSWFIDFDPVKAKEEGKLPYGMDEEISALFPNSFEDSKFGPIPTGWKYMPVGDVTEIVYGKNLPTSKLIENGFPVFGANGIIGYYDSFMYSDEQVLVSCRGEASGAVSITTPNCFITNNSLIIERKYKPMSSNYLFQILSFSDLDAYVTGSAQPQMTINNLKQLKILVPTDDLLLTFEEKVRSMALQSGILEEQSRFLTKTKDALLSRLMSGELSVS